MSVVPEGNNVGVNFNIENAFASYEHTDDYAGVLASATMVIADGLDRAPTIDVSALMDYENMKEKLSVEVISAEANADLLANVPHDRMEDLAVVYRFVMESSEDGRASILVTNNLIHDCDLYDIWKNEKLEYITVDFVRRIPVDIFEKWYADQDVYRKVTHIPTAEELENDYICLQDAADLLGISREKLAKIARREEIGRLLDSTICNNKRWITRKSFQLFLNAQNVYYIMNDGDKQEESQLLQENETLSLEIKEYISRQDAAELAGVSVSTVTKWMQSGEFQCVGAGKVLRVHRQQFLNWLNEHREGVI